MLFRSYVDYQKHILDQLNKAVAGKKEENQEVKSLVIEFARDPEKAHEFNVASMAYNNHFFFKGIVRHRYAPAPPYHSCCT